MYLHDEGSLGGWAAVVTPAVHEHGLQVLVVSDASHHLQQGPGVLWPEPVVSRIVTFDQMLHIHSFPMTVQV